MPNLKVEEINQFNPTRDMKIFPRKYKVLSFLIHIITITVPYYLFQHYWIYFEYLQSPFLKIFFVGFISIMISVGISIGFYSTLYYYQFPFFEQFKTNNMPWPWKIDRKAWEKQLKNLLLHYCTNFFILGPLITTPLLIYSKANTTSEFPSILMHILTIRFLYFVDGFGFYWTHRFGHLPVFYKSIHKWHHRTVNTTAYAVVDSHPLEHLICNMLPKYIGLLILGPYIHCSTFGIYLFLSNIEGHDTHSGYSFPISPFNYECFYGNSDFHNFHHLKNAGNFGHPHDFYWDKIFGSDKPYQKYLENLKEKNNKLN